MSRGSDWDLRACFCHVASAAVPSPHCRALAAGLHPAVPVSLQTSTPRRTSNAALRPPKAADRKMLASRGAAAARGAARGCTAAGKQLLVFPLHSSRPAAQQLVQRRSEDAARTLRSARSGSLGAATQPTRRSTPCCATGVLGRGVAHVRTACSASAFATRAALHRDRSRAPRVRSTTVTPVRACRPPTPSTTHMHTHRQRRRLGCGRAGHQGGGHDVRRLHVRREQRHAWCFHANRPRNPLLTRMRCGAACSCRIALCVACAHAHA